MATISSAFDRIRSESDIRFFLLNSGDKSADRSTMQSLITSLRTHWVEKEKLRAITKFRNCF